MQRARLLIVDDDSTLDRFYREALAAADVTDVEFERDATKALERINADDFDVVIAAADPPKLHGLTLLAQLRAAKDHALPVILTTSQASVESAAEAVRLGERLPDEAAQGGSACREREAVGATQEQVEAQRELLRRQVERPYSFDDIIGTCPAMRRVYEIIERVADSDVDVLVVGETGTGKELVARSIHGRSPRASKPFVPVDCGAIPENLLESEFFGHERGAFTGADSRTIGLLEFADGGTFFLDELGELPLLLQAKLLRTLQERKIRRVGGRNEIDVDVRIVAATGRDLEAMIAASQFRRDLYYRINVVRIDLPPLRERGDDLGLLAEYFAARYSREMQRPMPSIAPEAYQVLTHYRWPGNVRELQNIIRRALALSTDNMIGLDDLPDALVFRAGETTSSGSKGYFEQRNEHISDFERRYLVELLTRHHGDVKTAAEEAQLPRGTLYRLMKNHTLEGSQFR